jgi:DNA modification methylase
MFARGIEAILEYYDICVKRLGGTILKADHSFKVYYVLSSQTIMIVTRRFLE